MLTSSNAQEKAGDSVGPFELLEGRNEEDPNSPYLEIYIVFLLSFFFFFRATPMAYGGSQARGLIRAAAASLYHSHSNLGSEPHL